MLVVRQLQDDLQSVLNVPVSIASERVHPAPAFHPARRQYDAMFLLGMLQSSGSADKVLRLGVTDLDIFLPVFTYVFGLASHSGNAAVVSLYRLRQENNGYVPDQDLLRWRLAKEALHELGHLAGLRHCPVPWCVMASSRSAQEVDLKDAAFCPACAEEIDVVSIPRNLKLQVSW